MNAKISDQLKIAAETGNVDLLYAVIQDDPNVLENIDKQQFVETPLHIAASMGHRPFAIEVMNLKPSFALKLNPQGFSPIHLAMQNLALHNGLEHLVLRFVDMNKDLVKIKGREGFTLLHFAVQIGQVELVAKFLIDCPESVEYLTVREETALHIAVKNEQYEVFEVLVIWLKTNKQRGGNKLEKKILNQKDEDGNTILHLSALHSEPQMIRLLVKTRINLNATNLEDKTALDMAVNVDNIVLPKKQNVDNIERILLRAGAKYSQQITSAPTLVHHKLRSYTTIFHEMVTWITRIKRDITEEQRSTWLLVATIVATSTYQLIVSPPGGFYQANASDNNVNNITSSNSTITNTNPGNVGKSILSKKDFFSFSILNLLSFFISIISMLFLSIPSRPCQSLLVLFPVLFFACCYLDSMKRISPTRVNSYVVAIMVYSIQFVLLIFCAICVYSILQLRRNVKKLSKPLDAAQTTVGQNH